MSVIRLQRITELPPHSRIAHPTRSLMDAATPWVFSGSTDIRKTFDRAREAMRPAVQAANVKTIHRRTK